MLFSSFRDTWDGENWQLVQGCPAYCEVGKEEKKRGGAGSI